MAIHVYVHYVDDDLGEMLAALITKQGGLIMSKLEDLQAAIQAVKADIVAEKQEVQTQLTALATEVQGLKDQLAAGSAVTEAQLDALIVSVNDIGSGVKAISEPHT